MNHNLSLQQVALSNSLKSGSYKIHLSIKYYTESRFKEASKLKKTKDEVIEIAHVAIILSGGFI